MEEFKNVQWEIMMEDLEYQSREELIQTIIKKQNEIEMLKFEVGVEKVNKICRYKTCIMTSKSRC